MDLFYDLVPDPKHAHVDWQTIEEVFPWFRDLASCVQDPVFHAEGDVALHTKMVVEALVAEPDWQTLSFEQRQSLFWSALLHDVAKPASTRVDPSGRVMAPGHSRRGQIMAREILWRMAVPFPQRETICHLITHHQLPFFLIERDAPERRAHLISHQTRCDLLALLATADAKGRVCPDRNALLDNIALFSELCREQSCLSNPRYFASAHSRFLYFRKENRPADYEAFDDWAGSATLLSGLPGSGKDSWLEAHARDDAVISLDDLREAFDVRPDEAQGAVVAEAKERARIALRAQRPLIWNATNLSRQIRGNLVDLFAAYKAKVRVVYLETTQEEVARRNRSRSRAVPVKIIDRMLGRWEPPDLTECHELKVVLT